MAAHKRSSPAPEALAVLGFTELEARVYADLIKRSGQTGYALAKRLGKGQPSIYAALANLEAKEAVRGTDAASRTYSATPPEELISRARSNHAALLEDAELAISRLRPEVADRANLLRIDNVEEIQARASSIIASAKETLLFEFTPPFGEALGAAISEAVRRGVTTSGLVMRAQDVVDGAHCVVSPAATKVLQTWPFSVLVLVADGRQTLIAGAGEAGAQGLWSDSVLLSVILNNALASDILLQEREGPDWAGPNAALFGKLPPGFAELIAAR